MLNRKNKEPEKVAEAVPKQDTQVSELDRLKLELALIKNLVLALANYTGQDTLMKRLGVDPKDLYKPGVKEINGKL